MNHVLKKSAVVLAAVAACAQAYAADYSWADHAAVEVGFATPAKGLFDDVFSFTLTTDSIIKAVAVANNNIPLLSIGQASFALYSVTDPTTAIFSGLMTGTTGSTQLTATLGAGEYFYEVIGKATGSAGGVYTLTSAVAAVPEPETYALFLAGLGAVGFLTARRRSN